MTPFVNIINGSFAGSLLYSAQITLLSMSHSKDDQKSGEAEFHRKTAVACFNKAWEFLDKKERTPEDEMQLLTFAHASRYHWSQVGKPSNFAVADWQISRAYGELKQPAIALLFARSSLDLCQKNNLSELLTSGYEGMARAYAVAKDAKQAKEHIQRARLQLELVKDEEDRKIYAQQIADTEALL